MKQITSTELTLNTRSVINKIIGTSEPVVVYTYNEPKVVIIDFKTWKINKNMKEEKKIKKVNKTVKKKNRFSEFFELVDKHNVKFDVPNNDVTTYIRKMRDEE